MSTKTRFWISVLLTTTLLAATPALGEDTNRFALIVGHNTGNINEVPLRYAEQDATRMRDILVNLGRFKKKNCVLLTAPTADELDNAILELKQRFESADPQKPRVLIVYFAGHGDKDSIHLGDERYDRRRLAANTDSPVVDVKIAIVDACRTLETGRAMGVSAGGGFDVSIARSSQVRGRVTIQSSAVGEPAHESDRLKGAIFSHHLIGGLRGAADTDSDGKVTLLEAYHYAYRGTVKDSARGSSMIQHPNFDIDLSGTEDVVMTSPADASSHLVLTSDGPTVFQVFALPYFSPVAEFTLPSKKTVTVAAPSGRLLVQRRTGDELSAAELKLYNGEKRFVASYEYAKMSIDVTRRRGGAVDTAPNKIRLAATTTADRFIDRWIPRFGGAIGYERLFRYFKLGVDVSVTYAHYKSGSFDNREINLISSIGLGLFHAVGIHSFGAAIGPFFEMRLQHRHHLDHKRLSAMGFSSEVDERLRAFAPGGFVDVKWDVEITSRLDFSVSIRSLLSAMPVVRQADKKRVFNASIGGAAGINYRF